jgi:hypothetical protein
VKENLRDGHEHRENLESQHYGTQPGTRRVTYPQEGFRGVSGGRGGSSVMVFLLRDDKHPQGVKERREHHSIDMM